MSNRKEKCGGTGKVLAWLVRTIPDYDGWNILAACEDRADAEALVERVRVCRYDVEIVPLHLGIDPQYDFYFGDDGDGVEISEGEDE